MNNNIKIWLGDLGKYNEGDLVGQWIDLPMDADELQTLVNKYSNGGTTDYFIADWESPITGLVSEHSAPQKLNEIAEQLDKFNEYDLVRVKFLVEDESLSIADALEGYEDVMFYEGQSLKDVAYSLVEDGCFGDIPDSISNYIDYDAIARDLGIDGYTENSLGVFKYCD